MKIKFIKIGYPLYCDTGLHEGDMRIDLAIRLYLPPEEYARYEGPESLQITLRDNAGTSLRAGSAAEPSGEPPAGDAVSARAPHNGRPGTPEPR